MKAWRWTWNWTVTHTATAVFALFCIVVVGAFGLTWWTLNQIHHQQHENCQLLADSRLVQRNLWFGLIDQSPNPASLANIRLYVDKNLPPIQC